MKYKAKYYWMYVYHKDIYIAKFKTKDSNLLKLSTYLSQDMIISGMKKGYKISHQIILHTHFADMLAKQRLNCQKVRKSDLQMFLSSHMALYKFGAISSDNFLFHKKKVVKKQNGNHKQRQIQ